MTKINSIHENSQIVSIVIPVKNEEINIERCLISIDTSIKQSGHRAEVIIIDNGSNDNTVEIAKNFSCKVFIKPHLTISALRNFGVQQAKGSAIAFIDADISVAPDWLQKGVKHLGQAGIVCVGGLIDIPANATWIEKAWNLKEQIKTTNKERAWQTSMNLFVEKKAFLTVGGFNEQLSTCEDVDFCFRINSVGKLYYHKDVRVIHHGEAKTLSHFFLKEKWRGQSNLKGFFSHKAVLSELPSVIVPIFYLWFYISIIPLLFFFTANFITWLNIVMFISIPATRSLILCAKGKKMAYFFPLFVLWVFYYTARAVGLISFSKKIK